MRSGFFGPHAYDERVGDVDDAIFPTGAIVEQERDELRMYYSAADFTIAVACAKLSDVMDYVLSSPELHH